MWRSEMQISAIYRSSESRRVDRLVALRTKFLESIPKLPEKTFEDVIQHITKELTFLSADQHTMNVFKFLMIKLYERWIEFCKDKESHFNDDMPGCKWKNIGNQPPERYKKMQLYSTTLLDAIRKKRRLLPTSHASPPPRASVMPEIVAFSKEEWYALHMDELTPSAFIRVDDAYFQRYDGLYRTRNVLYDKSVSLETLVDRVGNNMDKLFVQTTINMFVDKFLFDGLVEHMMHILETMAVDESSTTFAASLLNVASMNIVSDGRKTKAQLMSIVDTLLKLKGRLDKFYDRMFENVDPHEVKLREQVRKADDDLYGHRNMMEYVEQNTTGELMTEYMKDAEHLKLSIPIDLYVNLYRKIQVRIAMDSINSDTITASCRTQVRSVNVISGQHVRKGETVMRLDAMTVNAPRDGVVRGIKANQHDAVEEGYVLLSIV